MTGPKAFPVARSNFRLKESKTPLVKKGRSFKNSHIRQRLKRERQRSGVSPITYTSSPLSDSSTNSSIDNQQPFQTRFARPRVDFKTVVPFTSISAAPQGGTKFLSPRTSLRNLNQTTRIPSPRKKVTLVRPSPTPPSATKASQLSSSSPETAPTQTDSKNKITISTKFVQHTVNEVSPSQQVLPSVDKIIGDDDHDVASNLCLVPLLFSFEEQDDFTCYWPCLVFLSLEKAVHFHKRLYPNQKKILKRLSKRLLKPATSDENLDHRVVVLPLGNSEGCCPSGGCKRPLFDVIDVSNWTTLAKKKCAIESGGKVIRLLENIDLVGSYLRDCKRQIDDLGIVLKDALIEMERLLYLDDDVTTDNEEGGNKENVFVSSFVEQPKGEAIRFPLYSPMTEWSRKQSSQRETPIIANTHKTPAMNDSAVKFPRSTQKSRKRPAPSMLSDIHPNQEVLHVKKATPKCAEKEDGNSMDTHEKIDSGRASRSSVLSEHNHKKRRQDGVSPLMETTTVPKSSLKVVEAEKIREKKARATSTTKEKKRASANKPAVIDSKGRISVSSWGTIKPLLMQLGHSFYENHMQDGRLVQYFCRPNGNPDEHSEAVEGEDYFTSLVSYRAHLCAHGVEFIGTKSPLKDDDLELIAYWVRFHIFSHRTTGERKTEIITDWELTGLNSKFIRLLQRIGYKYKYDLQEGYVVPGTKLILSEKELWEHLAKHGLSSSCKFEKFESKEEQMAIEIQIIRKYHGNHGDKAFRPIQKMETDNDEVEQDTDEMNESKYDEFTPAANKDALEVCTRGPDSNDEPYRQEAMSPRKLMTETPVTRRSAQKESNKNKQEESESNGISKGNANMTEVSTVQKNTIAAADNESTDDKNKTSKVPTAQKKPVATDAHDTKGSNKIMQPATFEVDLPGTTNDEKLKACQVNLKKNEIVAHGQLSNSIARIKSFVDTVIETKGRKGDGTGSNTSPILYICGNPGTGKTMSTTKICQDAITAITESKEEWEKAPQLCHISCPSLKSSKYHEGISKIMERMGVKQNQLKRSKNEELNSVKILVLDEVDQMLGSKGSESILKQLSSWAKDENYTLSIIGISNAVFNNKTDRLREYGMGGVSNKLVFQTYRKEDLVAMSQSKIGFTVVDKKAHEFIAAKVANSSGDARQYLDLVERAVIHCKRKLSLEKRSSPHTKPIVMIRDAMLAIRETNRKSKDIIQSLTSYEKMTLCAGVHLARKLGGKTVQMGKLRELTMQAFGMDADVSLEEFKGIIERLHDNGLLQLNENEKQAFTKLPMYNLLRYPVQFDLQLEDVDSALEDTVMKEDFYKRMVNRLKSIRV